MYLGQMIFISQCSLGLKSTSKDILFPALKLNSRLTCACIHKENSVEIEYNCAEWNELKIPLRERSQKLVGSRGEGVGTDEKLSTM